jgi:hypothetical protein
MPRHTVSMIRSIEAIKVIQKCTRKPMTKKSRPKMVWFTFFIYRNFGPRWSVQTKWFAQRCDAEMTFEMNDPRNINYIISFIISQKYTNWCAIYLISINRVFKTRLAVYRNRPKNEIAILLRYSYWDIFLKWRMPILLKKKKKEKKERNR